MICRPDPAASALLCRLQGLSAVAKRLELRHIIFCHLSVGAPTEKRFLLSIAILRQFIARLAHAGAACGAVQKERSRRAMGGKMHEATSAIPTVGLPPCRGSP